MTRQMTEAQRERRRQVQHERYMRKRIEIRAYQKNYYETHKEEIKAKRRQREFERRYLQPKPPPKTRKELDHEYYMRHRIEIIARSMARKKRLKEL